MASALKPVVSPEEALERLDIRLGRVVEGQPEPGSRSRAQRGPPPA